MKKIFINFLFFVTIFFSCKFNNYETVEKDRRFRDNISTGSFTELSEGHTYYEIKNKDSINTLIFIHGFSVPSYIWDVTFNKSVELGYKSLKIDLYGRGYSSNLDLDYTDELFANQVIELLKELDIEKATFLADLIIEPSFTKSAILNLKNPDCLIPKNCPGPRSFKSSSEIRKPSLVSSIISRRLLEVLVVFLLTRMQ